jgi:hypothetical protein
MSRLARITLASFLAGAAVQVAAGPIRPPAPRRPVLTVVPDVDDLEPADCTDVLEQHGIEVS